MKNLKRPDVSIIVPVYCVESYLDKCVQSLLKQTHKEIEILLVDDGSPDNCGIMCDEYQRSDNRIKVIHKENGGLSDARNSGLKKASGKYTLFVDSDDYLELDAVEILFNYAEKNELEILNANAKVQNDFNYSTLYGAQRSLETQTGLNYFKNAVKSKTYYAAVWLRMYRTEFLTHNNLYFKNGLLHEDEQWTPYTILKAEKVGYINYTFYNYILRKGSITQSENREKHIVHVINTCVELVDFIKSLEINEDEKSILSDYFIRLYINTVTYGEYNNKFYSKNVSKSFPIKNSRFFITKIKSLLFLVNFKLYRIIATKHII